MSLVVLLMAALLNRYFRDRAVSVSEAVRVGALVAGHQSSDRLPDVRIMPHEDDGIEDYSEIGLAYLAISIFAIGGAAGATMKPSTEQDYRQAHRLFARLHPAAPGRPS